MENAPGRLSVSGISDEAGARRGSAAAVRVRSLRRWRRHVGGAVGIVLVMFGVITATLPPVRRVIANPAGQPPVEGVTSVRVRADAFQNHLFDPPVIRVPAGTTITWTFVDRGIQGGEEAVEHNVVGQGFASPLLATGSWSRTFTDAGTYRYVCTLHRYMDGQIEVVGY